MINIRKNIFETNSSSTHAICIAKDNDYSIPSELNFTFDEFGWENRFIYNTEELASYLYTALYEVYYNDIDKIENFKNYIYETLGKYGCECTFEEPAKSSWGYFDSGCIDHGSELFDLARENSVVILYEAAVAGGIPIILPIKTSLKANNFTSVATPDVGTASNAA